MGKKSKISSKIGFLVFDKNLIYWPVFCTLKWCGAMLFIILQKQYYCGKSGSLFLQQKMLSTNQNAGLFGQQHLLMELIDILDFCTVIKVFGSVWPVKPFIQANCRIIWSSIFLEGIIFILVFLYGIIHQGKLALWTNIFWWGLTLIIKTLWPLLMDGVQLP